MVHDDPGLLEPEEQADTHSHEPERAGREQTTELILSNTDQVRG